MSTTAKAWLTIGFACSSGWSEVICFKRYASFAALMTGNTVKAGIAAAKLFDPDAQVRAASAGDVGYYLCVLTSYMLGATAFQFFKNWMPTKSGMVSAPVCAALVAVCEVCNSVWPNSRWHVCILAPTFGIQNSLTFGGGLAANTTIITGNMQKMSLAIYQCLTRKMNRAKLIAIVLPFAAIISTLLSAVAGAAVLMYVADDNLRWLFVPSGVLQAGLMVVHDVVLAKSPGVVVAPASAPSEASSGPGPLAETSMAQNLLEGKP